MEELSRKVEAILYSSKGPLKISEIAEYLETDNNTVLKCMREIIKNYESINSSLTLGQFGNRYKIKLNDDFIGIVSPFIDREFNEKELSMLSYIYKNPSQISGILREKFGYNYKDTILKLQKEKMVRAKKYRNTFKYEVTKDFYKKFNINKRTIKKEAKQ